MERPFDDGLRKFRIVDDFDELLFELIPRESSPLAAFAFATPPGTSVVEVFLHDASALDQLAFHVQDHHRAALAAPEETGIGIVMDAVTRPPFAPEHHLHSVILLGGNHGRVLALYGLPAPLEFPVIERIREDLVERREVEGFRLGMLARSRLREAAIHRSLPDLRHRVGTREEFLPRELHEREALGVFFHDLLALHPHVVAPVAERWAVRFPPVLHFLPHAPFHVLAEVDGVLRRHAKLHGHLDHVIRWYIRFLGRDDRLDDTLLEEPLDASSVDGVAGETIQAPANDGIRFARFDEPEHFGEQWASGLLRRHLLVKRSNDSMIVALRPSLVFLLLCGDGEDLLVLFVLRTFAVVDDNFHGCEGKECPSGRP